MSTEKELMARMQDYAASNGFKLNPNKRLVTTLIKGIVKNELEFGELYCPCRRITGNKRRDKRIICPCVYHKREIKKFGHCYCGLFVKGL